MRSFSESDTEYILEKGNNGKPTGVVICAHCGAGHLTVEEIPHDSDCDQRGVVSRWWEQAFAAD